MLAWLDPRRQGRDRMTLELRPAALDQIAIAAQIDRDIALLDAPNRLVVLDFAKLRIANRVVTGMSHGAFRNSTPAIALKRYASRNRAR